MDTGIFRFNVGTLECMVVSDGTGAYSNPAQLLFNNAPQAELSRALLAHNLRMGQWQEWVSSYNGLVIRSGGNLILVDTGYGKVEFSPNAGQLLPNLRSAGIAPGDIDTVILTHGHRDHLYGVTGDATGEVTFANARHVMWWGEWEYWNSAAGLDRDDGDASRKLSALGDRLELIDQEMEIAPGVHVIPAPGHTPGHVVVAVESEGERLLHLVDAVGHPIHLEHPAWAMRLDHDPEMAVRTRHQLLARAEAQRARILAYHFDFPGLGYIQAESDAWKWQPIEAAIS
jgi:glyoxylase-like metal-dependent hydrolase (beta-lactamase superfamily II)